MNSWQMNVVDGYVLTDVYINESLGCIEGEWTKVAASSTDFSSKNDIEYLNATQAHLYMIKKLKRTTKILRDWE